MRASINRFRKGRSESGFTLIELLIVIVILAILVAIVLFAVGGFTGTSAQAACRTDMKQLQTADSAYYAQHGAWPTAEADLSPTYLNSLPPVDQASAETAGNHYFVKWTAGSPPTVIGTYDDGTATWAGSC